MADDESNGAGLPSLWGPVRDVLSGITLPVRVANSLYKAADRVIQAGAEIPAAWLSGKAQEMHRATEAKDIVARAAAEAAAKQFDDPELAARALARYGADIVRQQANLESILRKATEEIASDPPQQDPAEEIDDDWLSRFYSEASKTSDEEMQTYLGKILAGEIKQPGSFSVRSVLTLCMIGRDTANSFQHMCNMTCGVTRKETVMIWEQFGNPAKNSMRDLNITYETIVDLAQNDLILYDFDSWRNLEPLIENKVPFDLGGKTVLFTKNRNSKVTNMQRVRAIKLTRTGQELRRILSLQWNGPYTQKFKEWLNENGVDLILLTHQEGGRLHGR
jgi:Protein of unknown function (DUF2806)